MQHHWRFVLAVVKSREETMIKFNIMGGLPESEEFITASENKKNTQTVIDDWMLGPENPSIDPTANKPFWSGLSIAMLVDDKVARRRRCSYCEY